MRIKRLASFVAVSALTGVLALASANAETPQPQLTQQQTITPADFTSVEANFYKTLDPSAQQNFIATRSFVRVSQQVVDGVLPAAQLPDRPAGFNVKYLLHGDAFDINSALAAWLTATNGGEGNLVPDMTAAQMLQPSDLTPNELSAYQALAPADAKHFLVTRSYMRICQAVLDKKLPAEELPKSPHGIRGAYLLPGESKLIDKAVSESLDALFKKYPNATMGK